MVEQADIELLRQAKAGRQEAFHRLVDRYAPSLLRLARSQVPTHHDAEDLVQETFTAAFRGLGSFEERSSVKTWLYAILFRQASTIRRKLGTPHRALHEDVATTAGANHRTDARLDVEAALANLSEDSRTIIILRELEGLSYEEIAGLLEVPRGTVESRLFRARQALKEWLAPRSTPSPR